MAPGKSRAPLLKLLRIKFPERSKEQLYAAVLHGDVLVNGHREKNPRAVVAPEADIRVENHVPYASRGGYKLESVLSSAENRGFAFRGKVVLDVGASSGGFTDCLLRHKAASVHAVDVGYNQLEYRLRCDQRVIVRERCNIRALSPGDLIPTPQAAVADLSFRSMEGVAASILGLLEGDQPMLLALIKPQFELERSGIVLESFSGVIEDEDESRAVLENVLERLALEGVTQRGLWSSGVKGGKGNQEFFALLCLESSAL